MNKAHAASHRDTMLSALVGTVLKSQAIVLTTHRYCDGDGLGALLAVYHGLKQSKKNVRIVTVDPVPAKYHFLLSNTQTESFDQLKNPLQPSDLALVFDTNDHRLIQPLYEELQNKCRQIIFIDHHPVLSQGPKPSEGSVIDTTSASTGELSYFFLKKMNIPFNRSIAGPLYASILFDTQKFRFIKNSAVSYQICADIYPYLKDNNKTYSLLFDIHSQAKLSMLSKAINKVQYFHNGQAALLEITQQEMHQHKIEIADTCDFIDLIFGSASVELAVLIVNTPGGYKLSFRSKNKDVSKLAEQFGGGGHTHSAGASLLNCSSSPKPDILNAIKKHHFPLRSP